MSLAEIKDAVQQLTPEEFAELQKFIADQDHAAWTRQMKKDAAADKLDFLFGEAERERAAGQLRDWPEKQ